MTINMANTSRPLTHSPTHPLTPDGKSGSARWQPNPAQRLLLESLAAEVAREKSAAEFARRYCDFGPAKLSKILKALDSGPDAVSSYFDEINDPEAELESLDLLITEARNKRSAADRITAVPILPLSKFRAVAQAVRQCCNRTDPERVIKYLAPTGGAKSMLCNYLAQTLKVAVVESHSAWRRSYHTVLTDIIRAIGLRIPKEKLNFTAYLQDKLIEAGNERNIVVAIDEAEFFGAEALNGMKILLNRGRFTFVICAIQESHDRWNDKFRVEADQITRRTYRSIKLTKIIPEDAALFFNCSSRGNEAPSGLSPASLELICDSASMFGHYSLIARIAEALQGVRKPDADDVAQAIDTARKQMGLSKLTK